VAVVPCRFGELVENAYVIRYCLFVDHSTLYSGGLTH